MGNRPGELLVIASGMGGPSNRQGWERKENRPGRPGRPVTSSDLKE